MDSFKHINIKPEDLELKEFDWNLLLRDYFRMMLIGDSSTGKSYYFYILYKEILKKYYEPFVFTKPDNRNFYENKMKIPSKNIFTDSSKFPQIVNRIYEFQRENILKYDKDGNPKYKWNALILFDDIIDSKIIKTSPTWWEELWKTSRHLGISAIFIMQSAVKFISSDMYTNSTYIVSCRLSHRSSRGTIQGFIRDIYDEDDEYEYAHNRRWSRQVWKKYVNSRKYGKIVIDNYEGIKKFYYDDYEKK